MICWVGPSTYSSDPATKEYVDGSQPFEKKLVYSSNITISSSDIDITLSGMTKSDYNKSIGIIISGTAKITAYGTLYLWSDTGAVLEYFPNAGSKTLATSIFFNYYNGDNERGIIGFNQDVKVFRYISGQGILLRLAKSGGIVTITNTKIYALLLN